MFVKTLSILGAATALASVAFVLLPREAPIATRAAAVPAPPLARAPRPAPPLTNRTPPPEPNAPLRATDTAKLDSALAAADPADRVRVVDDLLPGMVEADAESVARHAELQTDPQLRELLIRRVAQLWVPIDSDSATAWAQSLPDSPERDATLIDVALALALIDPERAVHLRERAVGNLLPDGVLDGLVQQWAEKDFDAALAWTNGRPPGVQREELLQHLVFVRAARGAPAEAALLANAAFDDHANKREAIAVVALVWERSDPRAASDWLESVDASLRP